MTSANQEAGAATEPKPAGKASAIAFNVRKGAKRNFWLRCGVEFAHEDGKGSNILLNVMPLNGRIAVRAEPEGGVPGEAGEGSDAGETAAEETVAGEAQEVAKADPRAPDYVVWSVRDAAGRGYWTEIGIAYRHKDGKGKSISLHALSLDGRLVLRERSERVRKEPASATATAPRDAVAETAA